MQPLGMSSAGVRDYRARLYSSHDFDIEVQVLNLDEKPTGTGRFIDGQVNLQHATIRRTCTLTLSDPDGAFDFDDSSRWSPDTIWADRLIRVRHHIKVPGRGTVTVTPFIGPPSSLDRDGIEVHVEAQDKTALAIRGTAPLTVKKGANAVAAIRKIMRERTGEFRFRMPSSRRKLSRNYSVGWADDASPWQVASAIARRELGMQLLYSCDGYLLLRRRPRKSYWTIPHVTSPASTEADFTDLTNWVRVRGKKTTKTKTVKKKKDDDKKSLQALPAGTTITTTSQPQSVVRIKAGRTFSPEWLARKRVPRYWPTLIDDDSLTKLAAVRKRAADELEDSSRLNDTPVFTCVPVFHLDSDDLVRITTPEGTRTVRLGQVSIPLGVSGDMSIGETRRVSRIPAKRYSSRLLHTRKVRKPKKKKKKTSGSKKK